MRLFTNRPRKPLPPGEYPGIDRAAGRMASRLLQAQQTVAAKLNHLTRTWSPRTLTVVLAVFSTLCTALSAYLLVSGLTGGAERTALPAAGNIRQPLHTSPPLHGNRSSPRPAEEWKKRRVPDFRRTLDSLRAAPDAPLYIPVPQHPETAGDSLPPNSPINNPDKSKHMEKQQTPPATQRKRRMLLVLPVLVLPFLTLGFWALGGGRHADAAKTTANTGLNTRLPEARVTREKKEGKLRYYQKAAQDSARRAALGRSDPFFTTPAPSPGIEGLEGFGAHAPLAKSVPQPDTPPYDGGTTDPGEEVLQKLARLQKGLEEPPAVRSRDRIPVRPPAGSSRETDLEVERLEQLMEQVKQRPAPDPQIGQLETVMDKILDIQHPDRVRRRLQQTRGKDTEGTTALPPRLAGATVSLLDTTALTQKEESGFYGPQEEQHPATAATALQAAVHGSQVITEGATVKLRLLEDTFIGGEPVPSGTLVYGSASLRKERLLITITTLRAGRMLLPVRLDVYDLDGLEGIRVPGSRVGELAGATADRSLGTLELSTLDPSLKAKAVTAGLGAAKNLLQKKARQPKVTLKAGYQVLLRDKSSKP